MYFTKTPPVLKQIASDLLWNVKTDHKELFLTFDDGPIPGVTPAILDILKEYNAKGTFFCVGENVLKHPEIFERIKREGHAIGNHTTKHLHGWKTAHFTYLRNYLKCDRITGNSGLFRPPYGRITPAQVNSIKKRSTIVMWDVLSGDFDQSLSSSDCARTVISKSKPGSIIVLHDSLKSEERVLGALPLILEHFKEYVFKPLKPTLK